MVVSHLVTADATTLEDPMLPCWLTALPRFVHDWRDEIVVVGLGLFYQAGISGALGNPQAQPREQVVVRIAAESPRPIAVTSSVAVASDVAVATAFAGPARYEALRLGPARLVAPRAARATRIWPAAPDAPAAPETIEMASPVVLAPVEAPAQLNMARAKLGAAAMARAFVVTPRRARTMVLEAGENIAADVAARVEVDTCPIGELRTSLNQTRAALDEARIRAAIQKALAAERVLVGLDQGPGV